MLQVHFLDQIKRLTLAYGDKAINQEKTRLLWDKFKHLDDGTFSVVIDNIILNQRQSPTLDDFIKNLFDANKQAAPEKKLPVDLPICDGCDGSAFSDQDRSLMIETINRRMKGKAQDGEWKEFKKNIDLQIVAHESTHKRVSPDV